jgi:hypothetical protein
LGGCYAPKKGISHHAEATDMLSAVRFLYHLTRFCNASILNSLIYTSNNKCLITRMKQRLQYDACFSNTTLSPDWDLTEAIHDITQHLVDTPTFQHVLRHQDIDKDYTALTLTAQLNVRRRLLLEPLSHLLLTTNAQLNIGSTTITGHYKHHIRQAASRQDFFDQCQAIHKWDDSSFQTINLALFRTAVRNSCHIHKFLFKFIHQVLRTQAQKYKWGRSSDSCPTYHETDNQQNFLRCSSPSITA